MKVQIEWSFSRNLMNPNDIKGKLRGLHKIPIDHNTQSFIEIVRSHLTQLQQRDNITF